MNRSIFQSSPFRPAYGLQPILQQSPRPAMGGILDDIAGDLTALNNEMDSFFQNLPVEVAGPYAKRRDECMAKPTIFQYECLWALFQEMKRGTPPAPPPPPPAPPATSSFPIVPVAIGAVAAIGILYIAFGRGK